MTWKKFANVLLSPPLFFSLLLVPLALSLLVYALVFLPSASPLAIAAYVLSAYTLTVWCFRLPRLISFARRFRRESRLVHRLLDDVQLRTDLSLGGALFFNTVYAIFHFALGILYRTFWFTSLGFYYAVLALLRFSLFRYARRHTEKKETKGALLRYRMTGVIFLLMGLALSLVLFFMLYFRRTFFHGQIVTITLAAYTFLSLTFAILGILRYRVEKDPIADATRATSLAAASVSLLTLTSTMLTTFGSETMTVESTRLFVGLTGTSVVLFITVMAAYMIVTGTRKIKLLRNENTSHGTK